jgi:hypothetical protein
MEEEADLKGRGRNVVEERNMDDDALSAKSGSPEISHAPSPDVMEIDPPGIQ